MKTYFFVLILALNSFVLNAQPPSYNVVFDLTSGDTTDHQALMRWIKGISSENPNAKLEVVFYGKSLPMVEKDKSAVENDVKELLARKAVALKVCAIAMKRHQVDKSQLIDGVEVVPDGIYEIISRQHDGWGYIKVSH